jgi:hypothetical protein
VNHGTISELIKPEKGKSLVKISSYRYKGTITVRISFLSQTAAQFVASKIKKTTEKAVEQILAELRTQ